MLGPGDFFASKSLKLLGSGVLEKKKEFEKKKSCHIISFGDFFRNKWYPGMIFIYRYGRYIVMFTYLKNTVDANLIGVMGIMLGQRSSALLR